MTFYKENMLEAIGNTPIVKLNKVTEDIRSEILVKCEFLNPGGSIKDRIGYFICEQARKNGKISPGGTIVEATSGNTGVGIAMWAAINNCNCVFVMADKQSPEKIRNLEAFGARVVLCPTNVEPEDSRSYYSVAKRLADTLPNCFYANQYHNLDNPQSHYEQTGPEIFEQTQGDFDCLVVGCGTGGTISGTGKYLKEKMPDLKVVGVDIKGSILAQYHRTGDATGAHNYVLEGLGEDFIPSTINFDVIDDWVVVEDEESFQMTRRLLREEAIYAGGSCGAAVVGAIRYAQTLTEPKRILVILPDSGNRYASKIFNDQWMKNNHYQVNTVLTELDQKIQQIKKEQGLEA